MKFQLLKQAVIGPNVPRTVFDNLYGARDNDLKVILYVLDKDTIDVNDISRNLQITQNAIISSLLFWADKGLVLRTEEDNSAKKEKKTRLTSRQILEISVSNPEIEFLVNSIQQIYGHAVNENGINAFLNLNLVENVPVEVIVILAAHYAPIQKGPGYTARVIGNLFNKEGITSGEKAEDHIRLLLKRNKMYDDVCRVFGLDKTKLTTGEKTIINRWDESLEMSMDMIKQAYISAGINAGIKYCNGILKSWSQKRYKTPRDIQNNFGNTSMPFNFSGKNIDRQEDVILQGMNIVPAFDKGE